MDNKYIKISPLGPRKGPGTFDCWYDTEKYLSVEEAAVANDLVIVDFVKDENDIIYFELHHTKAPRSRRHYQLEIQNFIPAFGIDAFDDDAAERLAYKMLSFFP